MHNAFIGLGVNPGGPDLPLGLGMNLAQSPSAHQAYAGLSNERKRALIDYIQSASTGEEARSRMAAAIDNLGHNNVGFF